MTALTVPAGPEEDASPRPVPWRRMAWVTWRQHRVALTGVAALLGAVAVYVWIVGRHLHHAYAAAIACHPARSLACGDLASSFNGMYAVLANGTALQPVPALIGAFVGAPVLARELETGTFRYAWTQGFGRWRWTLAKLVLLAVVVAAAAGALSMLFSWYYQPYFAAGNQTLSLSEVSPFAAALFDLRGVVFAAWTLVAFAIGGLAGVLIRRVVPAIVATLVVYAGLALAVGMFLRHHYLTPLVTSKLSVPASAWITSQWWTKGGKFVFAGRPPINLLQQFCPAPPIGARPKFKPSSGTLAQCLSQHGYTRWTSYQPASRFWPFQFIEGGWLLALSLLLIATTVWLVRRRAT
jgi:ABC-2 family transporter protein